MANLFDCDSCFSFSKGYIRITFRNPHQQTRCKFATSFATEFCICKPIPKFRAN